jgi:hypothetical protein
MLIIKKLTFLLLKKVSKNEKLISENGADVFLKSGGCKLFEEERCRIRNKGGQF